MTSTTYGAAGGDHLQAAHYTVGGVHHVVPPWPRRSLAGDSHKTKAKQGGGAALQMVCMCTHVYTFIKWHRGRAPPPPRGRQDARRERRAATSLLNNSLSPTSTCTRVVMLPLASTSAVIFSFAARRALSAT